MKFLALVLLAIFIIPFYSNASEPEEYEHIYFLKEEYRSAIEEIESHIKRTYFPNASLDILEESIFYSSNEIDEIVTLNPTNYLKNIDSLIDFTKIYLPALDPRVDYFKSFKFSTFSKLRLREFVPIRYLNISVHRFDRIEIYFTGVEELIDEDTSDEICYALKHFILYPDEELIFEEEFKNLNIALSKIEIADAKITRYMDSLPADQLKEILEAGIDLKKIIADLQIEL